MQFPFRIDWKKLSSFPWSPVLLALYAPSELGAHNIGQIPLSFIYRSVILSGIFGIMILLICRAFLQNWQVAGITAAVNGEASVIPERVNKGNTYYTERDYERGYVNQAKFISDRISQVVENIIKNSSTLPIIIIQGDHGPSHFNEITRMGILNAYYFPEAQPALYSSITPLNSFRTLFNTYFGTEFPVLKDTSYYSEYPYAYRFDRVPNQCQPKSN
jgi:hypothetical protein